MTRIERASRAWLTNPTRENYDRFARLIMDARRDDGHLRHRQSRHPEGFLDDEPDTFPGSAGRD